MATSNSTAGVASFEIGLAILAAFDRETPQLTLSEIADRCGITRFAARRYLASLIRLGYAECDGKRYTLTHRVLRMGSVFISSSKFVARMQPLLHQLTADVGESSYLCVRDGYQTVVVAKATANRLTNRSHALGAHFPMFVTSAGLCIAALLPDSEALQLLKDYRPLPYTSGTLLNPMDIHAQLELARQRAYAVSERQLDDLVRGIAVPLANRVGQFVGAISLNMFIGDESEVSAVNRMLPALRRTADAALQVL